MTTNTTIRTIATSRTKIREGLVFKMRSALLYQPEKKFMQTDMASNEANGKPTDS